VVAHTPANDDGDPATPDVRLVTDPRDVARPQEGNGAAPSGCDIGAYETTKGANGLDDDGDGRIDFDGGATAGLPPGEQTAPDPQCASATCVREHPTCGLGAGEFEGIVDRDGDLWPAATDNYVSNYNPEQTDTDDDGVGDACDNCTAVANALQIDTDLDGYGNACDADLNQDGIVNFADLALLKSRFFQEDANADLTGDNRVDFADLARMKALFLLPPGPSGLHPSAP